jgi:hypothetical protein
LLEVLYGCETWSLTLTEDHRLRVLRTFAPKRDEVAEGWRKLDNEELVLLLFAKYNQNDQVKGG